MTRSAFLPAGTTARYDVKTPIRDGTRLSADIYYPLEERGRYPVILSRTPYDNTADQLADNGFFYAQHGYVYVAQDVRGRNDSDGALSLGQRVRRWPRYARVDWRSALV